MSLLSLSHGDELILLDGTMGTELEKVCGEGGGHLSVSRPDQVSQIEESKNRVAPFP